MLWGGGEAWIDLGFSADSADDEPPAVSAEDAMADDPVANESDSAWHGDWNQQSRVLNKGATT